MVSPCGCAAYFHVLNTWYLLTSARTAWGKQGTSDWHLVIYPFPRPYHFHTDGTCSPLVYTTKRGAAEPGRFSVHCTCEWRGELYLLWHTWRGVLWSDAHALYGTISVHNKAAAVMKKRLTRCSMRGECKRFCLMQVRLEYGGVSLILRARKQRCCSDRRVIRLCVHARGELLSKYCVRPRWVCYPADNEAVCCCSWKALWGNVLAPSQHEREKEGWLQWVLHHQSPFM